MNPTPGPVTVLDATLTECVLHSARPLDAHALEALTTLLPLPFLPAAVPYFPPGPPAHSILAFAAPRALVVEPIGDTAHAHAARIPVAHRHARILVDPQGAELHDEPPRYETPGWTREIVAWLPRALSPEDTARQVEERLDDLPPDTRLRIRDAHGTLTPAAVQRITNHPASARLTLHLEDPHGLALATAYAATQTGKEGLLVRTSLLGIGPRSGIPATERLLRLSAPHAPTHHDLEAAAHAVAQHTGHDIPARHPLWGSASQEAAEPERRHHPETRLRTNPATLPHLLDEHLHDWELTLTADEHHRILDRLQRALRPGEPFDGAILWAVIAQEADLERIAADADRNPKTRKRHPGPHA